MEQLFNLLAIDDPGWTIPWAGLGAILLGLGSTLTGIAAIITARNKGRDEVLPSDDSESGNGSERGDPSVDAASAGSG